MQVGAEGAVLGERLGRWLSRPGADLTVLLANLHRHGSVRMFATGVQGELGGETDVEISAVGSPAARPAYIALLIRDVGRRLTSHDSAVSLQSALAAVVEQTGKTSLRMLVRDTVGLVERHYIGAALQIAEGNRTAAADILGLSRQGFYKKLAQYEMEGHSRVTLTPTNKRENDREAAVLTRAISTPAFGEADLSNCEREQIHLAGSIQPHGAMLLLREPDQMIVQASENAASFLGLQHDIIGRRSTRSKATSRKGCGLI